MNIYPLSCPEGIDTYCYSNVLPVKCALQKVIFKVCDQITFGFNKCKILISALWNLEKSATKTGKIRKMGRKRANWEENGKLAGSLPLRKALLRPWNLLIMNSILRARKHTSDSLFTSVFHFTYLKYLVL